MLTYIRSSIFDSPAQTLVNAVNTVGVMGKGIAKKYKEQYPAMFKEYKELCNNDELQMGVLHLWRGPSKWVLNFPTKTTWRKPSNIEYVRLGLEKFVDSYDKFGIRSISFPPLGCGNGELNWEDVRSMMEEYLQRLPIDIFVHDIQKGKGFVPEHREENNSSVPYSSEEFLVDVRKLIHENKGTFWTINNSEPFNVVKLDESIMEINRSHNRIEKIPEPTKIFTDAWSQMQHGLYTKDFFTDDCSLRYKSYIFAILKELPYLQFAEYNRATNKGGLQGHALYIKSADDTSFSASIPVGGSGKEGSQMQLWE